METIEQLDFAPTGLLMLVDGGSNLYRSVKTISEQVRQWDGIEERFAVESNAAIGVHASFSVTVTGRRVRMFRDMSGVRVQVRFTGEDETVGAWVLADQLDLDAVREVLA